MLISMHATIGKFEEFKEKISWGYHIIMLSAAYTYSFLELWDLATLCRKRAYNGKALHILLISKQTFREGDSSK